MSIQEILERAKRRRQYIGTYINTVGELKKSLEGLPDDMPLALDDRGKGWGLAKPYVAEHCDYAESITYYAVADPERAVGNSKLARPVCVIEPRSQHF